MNATTDDIKDYLEAEGTLALVFGTNLFISREPAKPNTAITLYDTPGFSSEFNHSDTEIHRDAFQVRVRATSYPVAIAKAIAIQNYLSNKKNITINATYYLIIRCTVPPHLLHWDDNNRAIIVMNFDVQRK